MADNPVFVQITDPYTDFKHEAEVPAGHLLIVVVEPAYLDNVQAYGNGTSVLTIKQRKPEQESHEEDPTRTAVRRRGRRPREHDGHGD